MSFSFLNPWLWLGALAIAAPIWLHLRHRQEKNLVRFSAVRFLDEAPVPRRSPLRLRDFVLFALRALALLLVVGAFAWPYIRSAVPTPVRESRVYILDNTLSRQSDNAFARDRDQLASELGGLGSGVQASVVELTSQPRVIAAFSDDPLVAKQKVAALEPSFQRGAFLAAFRLANSLLANSLGEQKRIILLSDNQANQWSENLSTPPFLHEVAVDLPGAGTDTQPNLSVSEPRVQRVFLGDRSLLNFAAKIVHRGPAPTAAVTLRANGQQILNRTLDFKDTPQTVMVQVQWEADATLWVMGELTVTGEPDALPADNRAFFALPPLNEGQVALLAQSSFLRVALSADVMRGQWATRVLDPTKLAEEVAAERDADVLCIESSYLQSADARKLVWRYLTNGRGVVMVLNRVTPAIGGCLREWGFECGEAVTHGKTDLEHIGFVMPNHPVFLPFLSPDFGSLMEVSVSRYTPVRSSEAVPLAFTEKGTPLVFQGTRTAGRLFMLNFALDREHTSWPVHTTFVPFLDLLLQTARADDPTPGEFEPAETAAIKLPPGARARELVVREGEQEISRTPVEAGAARVRIPEKPGCYALTYDQETEVRKVFAVNPSAKESELISVATPEALNLWRLPAAQKVADAPSARAARVSLANILRQRVWWWMLVGALAALALEMVVAGFKRQTA